MSMAGASGANIIRSIEGTNCEFTRPTRNEVAAQLSKWAAEDKQSLLRVLQESGAGPEIRLAMLKQHAEESRRLKYGLTCLFQIERAIHVVRTAYVGGADAFDAMPMDLDQVIELACELWAFNGLFDKKPDGAAGNQANDKQKGDEGDSRPLEPSRADGAASPANSTGT